MRGFLRAVAVFSALFTFACSAQTPTAEIKEGQQYQRVREAQAAPDAKRVLVEEIFWYGCPHCYALDPKISEWAAKRPADVDFVRVPTSLGHPQGVVHSKAFYTAEALGLGEKMHKPIFDAIHQQRLPLDTPEAMANFFGQTSGVMPDVFAATFNGFAVDSRSRRAEQLVRSYGISSVPTVVVGGRYYTNATMAGNFDGLIQCIDALIVKVRAEQKK